MYAKKLCIFRDQEGISGSTMIGLQNNPIYMLCNYVLFEKSDRSFHELTMAELRVTLICMCDNGHKVSRKSERTKGVVVGESKRNKTK